MDEEQTTEEEVTTEDYETNTDSEGETEEGNSETGDSERTYTQAEVDAIKKDRDKRWKERLEGSKKGSKEDSKEEVDENYQRLDLKTEGVKEKKEQDIVLDYIREKAVLGQKVTVSEALSKMVVKEALAEIRSKNVPAPSTRTSTGKTDSFEYYAKNIKAGKLRLVDVPDPVMRQRLTKSKIF